MVSQNLGQGGDLSHGMCDYGSVSNKVFGNYCLTLQQSYLAIARPLNFGNMVTFLGRRLVASFTHRVNSSIESAHGRVLLPARLT